MICGDAIVTYEHIEPLFAEAKAHETAGITLLCGSHHLEVTKGLLSKDTVRDADRNPYCKRQGNWPRHMLDVSAGRPKILLGGNDVSNCGGRIVLGGVTLFEIVPPELGSSVWRLSADLRHPSGESLCRVDRNEISFNPGSIDLKQTKNRFEVLDKNRGTILKITAHAPNGLSLDHFETAMPNGRLIIGVEELEVPSLATAEIELVRTKRQVLTFENALGGRQTFDSSTFSAPNGLYLDLLKDGVLRMGTSSLT